MASAQIVNILVTNNSPIQHNPCPADHMIILGSNHLPQLTSTFSEKIVFGQCWGKSGNFFFFIPGKWTVFSFSPLFGQLVTASTELWVNSKFSGFGQVMEV